MDILKGSFTTKSEPVFTKDEPLWLIVWQGLKFRTQIHAMHSYFGDKIAPAHPHSSALETIILCPPNAPRFDQWFYYTNFPSATKNWEDFWNFFCSKFKYFLKIIGTFSQIYYITQNNNYYSRTKVLRSVSTSIIQVSMAITSPEDSGTPMTHSKFLILKNPLNTSGYIMNCTGFVLSPPRKGFLTSR